MSTASTQPPPKPVMRTTSYERVNSGLLSVIIGLVVAVVCLYIMWMGLWPDPPQRTVPVEIVELSGGVEDGTPGEELRVDSPLPEIPDATPNEESTDEPSEIEETLDQVMDLSDEATNLAERQFEVQTATAGRAGSSKGTGRRGLGSGPGRSGFPREQRWFVTFADQSSITEYARQLDFFGIELAALYPEGKIVFLSNLSKTVSKRTAESGKGETRLYMTWQGGSRRLADMELLKKNGVDTTNTVVMQFYSKETETMMAQLELDYGKRKVDEIRRTYYAIEPDGTGYRFRVTRQIYFR
ncbi:MAG: hypothetical protein KDA68_10745 [Planctomycetaceae bacterium]|nr:hypothetical protein [Planctomycetaceae bacterium]